MKGTKLIINENKARAIMLGDDADARIELCSRSFRFFFMYYYSMYFHFSTPDFHKDMFQDLDDMTSGEITELLWLMFRESAKSSIAKAYVTWLILFEKKHFIVYDSYKKANAEQALVDIANGLRSNTLITNDFGFVLGGKKGRADDEEFTEQRSGGFTTVPSKKHKGGVKVVAMSTQESPRGMIYKQYRPDQWILDDIETFATKDSAAITEKVLEHIYELIGGKAAGASVLYLGNFITGAGSVASIKNRLEGNEAGRTRIVNIIDEQGELTWPSKYEHTIKEAREYNVGIDDANKRKTSVETKRQELGVHFEPEMMNNPFSLDDLVFNQERVDEMMKAAVKPVKVLGNENWYEFYNPGHRYAIGADVSKGIGKDNSAAVALDFTGDKVRDVLAFKDNKEDPLTFASRVASQGDKLGNCLIAPENNSIGYAMVAKLREIYPERNIYQYQRKDKVKGVNPTEFGWVTTGQNKADMMYDIINAFNDGLLEIRDLDILREMKAFQHRDIHATTQEVDKRARLGGSHFDLLISLAIAYQMRDKTRPESARIQTKQRSIFNKLSTKRSFR